MDFFFPYQATLQFSADTKWVSYNLIQIDTTYPELVSDLKVKTSVPQDTHPSPASDADLK